MSQRGYDNCQGQSRRRRKIKIRQDYVAIVFFCRSRRVAKAETISNHRRFQWPQGRFAPPPTPPRILLLGCFRCQPIVTKRPKVRVTIDNLPLVIGPPNGKLFLFKSAAMAKAGRRAGRNQFRLPFTRIWRRRRGMKRGQPVQCCRSFENTDVHIINSSLMPHGSRKSLQSQSQWHTVRNKETSTASEKSTQSKMEATL